MWPWATTARNITAITEARTTLTAAATPIVVNAAPSDPVSRVSNATRTTSPAFAGASASTNEPAQ
jgi:hypothetical protein